jgi:hypothetical protein
LYLIWVGFFFSVVLFSKGGPPPESPPLLRIETRHTYGDELTVEREITGPLETALLTLPGLTELTSISRRGVSRIECGFASVDALEDAYPLVRAAVNRVASRFGGEIGNPLILRAGGRDPIFLAAVPAYGDDSLETLVESFRAAGDCGEIRVGGKTPVRRVLSPAGPGVSARHAPSGLPPLLRDYLLEEGWIRDLGPVSLLPIVPGTRIGDLYEVHGENPSPRSEGRINGVPVVVVSVFPGQGGEFFRTCRRIHTLVDSMPGASVIYSSRKRTVSTLRSALIPFILVIAGFQLLCRISGGAPRSSGSLLLFAVFQCGAALAAASLLGRPVTGGLFGGIAAGIGVTQYLTLTFPPARKALPHTLVPLGVAALLLLPETILISPSPRGGCALGLTAVLFSYPLCAALLLTPSPAGPTPRRRLLPARTAAGDRGTFRRGRLPGGKLTAPGTIPGKGVFRAALVLTGLSGILPFIGTLPGAAGWDGTLSGSVCLPPGTPFTDIRALLLPWESRLLEIEGVDRVVLSLDEEKSRIYLSFRRGIRRRRAEGVFTASAGELAGYFFPDWEADRGRRALITVDGPDTTVLTALAEAAARVGTEEGGGTRGVFHFAESPRALILTADLTQLALAGTDLFSLYVQLFWRYSEGVAGKFADPRDGKLSDILIKSEVSGRPVRRETLSSGEVEVAGGKTPLREIAGLSERKMPGILHHRGTRRVLALSIYGPRSGGFTRNLEKGIQTLTVPPGYGISIEFPDRGTPVPPKDAVLTGLLTTVSLCLLLRLFGSSGAVWMGSVLGSAAGVSLLLPVLTGTAVFLVFTPLGAVYSVSSARMKRSPGTNPKSSREMRRFPWAS